MTPEKTGLGRHSREVVNGRPFAPLLDEHAFLRARLRRAIDLAGENPGGAWTIESVRPLRVAASDHMRIEEATLYPIGERLFGREGPLLVLRKDHAELDARLRGPGPIRDPIGWLENVSLSLEAHLGREERVLFPMMTAVLTGQETDRLSRLLRSTTSQ